MYKICMVTTSEIEHDSRILNEAAALAKKYELTILAKRYPLKTSHDKRPFQIKLIGYVKMPSFLLSILSSFFSLMRASLRENPDIFHAHDLDGLLCALPAALLKGKILIYDSHELWSQNYPFSNLKGIQPLLGPLERILMLKVQKGITVNQSIATFLKKRYHKDFLALRNISDFKINRGGMSLRKKYPGKKIILHLGSADEGRGLEQIIEASKFLPKNYTIVFLGGGKTEEKAKEMAKKIGANNIEFLPAVLPSKIISSIKEADLGLALTQKVSLSYFFSLPNKLFQYLAAQIPILGSNFPEFKKIILQNKIGEVVDPSKPKEIALKIMAMVKGNNLMKYRKNYQKIEKSQYSWEAESRKLTEYYQKITPKNQIPVSGRFKADVFWNIASLVFLAISSLSINILIARYYGAAALGMFNEVYAIYIIASQFAASGIHLSVQKYIPHHAIKSREAGQIISSALVLVLGFSLVVSIIVYFSRFLFSSWFKSPDIAQGIALIAFGLIGFALNKTLFGALNGFRAMKPFAFFLSLRYFFILIFIVGAIFYGVKRSYLPLAFTFAEVAVFIILFLYSLRFYRFTLPQNWQFWPKKHLIFGYHSFLGNVLVDINTRVDVIILGLLTSQASVGIFSFAAMVAEGFAQLFYALKNNVNPILSKLSGEKKFGRLEEFIKRGIKLTYLYFGLIALAGVALYPLILKFMGKDNFSQSWPVFVIIIAGMALSAGYQPFQMLLNQSGQPKLYSALILIVFIINAALNFVLIPILGVYGSALATALVFIASAFILKIMAKRALKIRI